MAQGILSPRQIGFIAAKYWTNERDREIAVAIAIAESGGNINAHNAIPPDDSYGLWQINMKGNLGAERRQKYQLPDNNALFFPEINARVAFGIYQDAGSSFSPWTTWKSGKVSSYMSEAADAVKNPEDPAQLYKDLGLDPGKVSTFQDPVTAAINSIIDTIVGLLKPFVLRVAGFIGGILLIGMAIRLYMRGGFK